MKKLLYLFIGALLLTGCDPDPTDATMSVRLVDAPADYEQVLIDVKNVEIHSDETGWQDMDLVEAGIYNLLEFTNGMDTLLAQSTLPPGRISQMRLVLGMENAVVIDGETIPLQTPSSLQSGLKFLIQADLTAGIEYEMWIDFDAGKSIVTQGNGGYLLKPVIRTYTQAASGSIHGSICDFEGMVYVEAIAADGSTTYGTYVSEEGFYQLNGLPAGVYTINLQPEGSYDAVVIENITVELGIIQTIDEQCFEASELEG